MSNETENSLAGLPIPPKEKVMRWASHIVVGALAVACINYSMPAINHALSLVLDGVWSLTQIAITCAALAVGAFGFMALWPAYKRFMESLANKATWAVFEYDPVTPMVLWLKEVSHDQAELEKQYREVCGVISQNEMDVKDTLRLAGDADKRFAIAVQKYGANSHQAQIAALEPGTLRETATRVTESTKPLYMVRDILQEVTEATEFTQRKAELDVRSFKQEFSAADRVERATNAANRVLKGRSQRKQDALTAMRIIHDKYAGSFGRLQGLRQLSQEVITSVDLTKGTFHQEALERLRNESRMITGNKSTTTAPVLDAVPAGSMGGVSLYKVNSISSNDSDIRH